MFYLYEVPRIANLQTRSRTEVTKSWAGERDGEFVGDKEKVLEMDNSDGQ